MPFGSLKEHNLHMVRLLTKRRGTIYPTDTNQQLRPLEKTQDDGLVDSMPCIPSTYDTWRYSNAGNQKFA
jgi:hypothetical protein